MKWTKRHSQNAVAARARKRMAALNVEHSTLNVQRSVPVPRRSRARFTLQIRDHAVGDSLTLNLHAAPWPNRWICEQGQFSTAHLAKAVGLILKGGTHA